MKELKSIVYILLIIILAVALIITNIITYVCAFIITFSGTQASEFETKLSEQIGNCISYLIANI